MPLPDPLPDATDPLALTAALVRCPSVTPEEGGALELLEAVLTPLGFAVERPVFSQAGTPDVENLWARIGQGRHLLFNGHTDVVPPGDETRWTHPPFSAHVEDGHLWGRGAVDMKSGVACFVAALARILREDGSLPGAVTLTVTGDEEAASINGTDKLLAWAHARGERWDAALVGEPSNPDRIGDAIKCGRRGSLSGRLTVEGRQGHSAYPERADNPVPGLLDLLDALLAEPFDHGTDRFQPTDLQVTTIDVGNRAGNVIPASATAAFNMRFNDANDPGDGSAMKAEILRRLEAGARSGRLRRGREEPVRFRVDWVGRVSPVFVTRDERLIGTLTDAVEAVTGRRPALSTGGGTSDARFVKDWCPVVEFGLVGRTMHEVDERVPLADLETLTAIYMRFIRDWFAAAGRA